MLGVLLWPLPLFGLLHAESAAVVAAAAFFTAGLSSISLFRQGHGLFPALGWHFGALIIPLVMLTVTLPWRPNCAYVDGLLFYGLFPVPSVMLAVALAYALDRRRVQGRRGWLVLIGVAICILGPIYDLGFHPQFYTYNHVFGGILGPVYDEELAIRKGLLVFRGLTVVWAVFLILAGRLTAHRSRSSNANFSSVWPTASGLIISFLVLLLSYAYAADLGFNTTMAALKTALPGHRATPHFDIYYSPENVSEVQLQGIADEHEFRYHELSRMLDVEIAGRIQSFIYPDHDVKADLTGARYTNVAPVWLSDPQSHVLASEFSRVFPHELAHVFSREFGLPLLNASLTVGLVEGLAVALEPPDGLPTPHEQVSAALLSKAYVDERIAEEARSEARELARVVASHLSPMGFWTGRGAVSYTTMGSFVHYLLDAYGAGPMKKVYASGNFSSVYGKDVEQLAEEWAKSLLALDHVDASAGPLVTARFAVPSILEKRCPHYVPPYRRDHRRATVALVRGDSLGALQASASSLEREPRYVPALDLWARLMLARGRETVVLDLLETVNSDSMTAALFVRWGDSRALTGDSAGARLAYGRALAELPSFAHEDAARIHLRIAAAGRQGIMRSLLDARSPPSGDDALTSIARSFHLARHDKYEQAADLLRTTPTFQMETTKGLVLNGAGVLHRRRLVWLAQFHYRAGAHSAASAYASEAAEAYRIVGAFNEAAQLDDFRRMMLRLASLSTMSVQSDALSQTVSK